MKIFLLIISALITYPAIAGDRFVIITDSHGVGKFGESLKSKFKSRPVTSYHYFASGGSAPLQWLNRSFTTTCGFEEASKDPMLTPVCRKLLTPHLSDIWAKYPTYQGERRITIIALGTNYSLSSSLYSEQVRSTKKLISAALRMSDICIWVGPPNMRRSPGFNAEAVEAKIGIIREAIGNDCYFIDSREFSSYPENGDGIHYHWPGSRDSGQLNASNEWAQAIFLQVENVLEYP